MVFLPTSAKKMANNRINSDLRRDAAQSGYAERWAPAKCHNFKEHPWVS